MSFKTKLIGAIQYFTLKVEGMNDYQEREVERVNKTLEFKKQAVREILEQVERNCRVSDDIVYTASGFSSVCFHNFEGSLQEEIVKELEDLGYKCIMSFNPTYLTVKGW